jgi:upstream activation factor subunit UAF30
MATAKKSGATKKAAKKATAKKSSGTKQARGGIAQPVKPSGDLAAVVGKDSLTRADLTKKVWDYIKKNDLQDSKNRRMINADAKLKPIFGGKSQVSMFEMTKLVNQHVTKA